MPEEDDGDFLLNLFLNAPPEKLKPPPPDPLPQAKPKPKPPKLYRGRSDGYYMEGRILARQERAGYYD
jgi:hypothetical protein